MSAEQPKGMQQPKRPVDMSNPTLNDILLYEIWSVKRNRYMSEQEKEEKVIKLKSEMTQSN
jgi:hypothetical protein